MAQATLAQRLRRVGGKGSRRRAQLTPGCARTQPMRGRTSVSGGAQPVLSPANFEGCRPGELLLSEAELELIEERLRRHAHRCAAFAAVRLAPVRDARPAPARGLGARAPSSGVRVTISKEPEWLNKRSRSRSRSQSRTNGKRQARRTARKRGEAPSAAPAKPAAAKAQSAPFVEREVAAPAPRAKVPAPAPAPAPTRPAPHGCLGPALTQISVDHLEVKEVEAMAEKDAAYSLHLSKNTFYEERGLVEFRIYSGDLCQCRTWVLVQPGTAPQPASPGRWGAGRQPGTPRGRCPSAGNGAAGAAAAAALGTGVSAAGGSGGSRGGARACAGRLRGGRGGWSCRGTTVSQGPTTRKAAQGASSTYLAAVTVRINSYQNRQGRWAQILNMSARRERSGFGTMLIAGLEELLKVEEVDVVVLYPAENGRAPAFWSSLGFGAHEVSCLPDEELVPHDQGGPLLPEFDTGSLIVLPRWEKRISGSPHGAEGAAGGADSAGGATGVTAIGYALRPTARRGRGGRRRAGAGSFRTLPPSKSRVKGEPLLRAHAALSAQRARHKAGLSAGPPEGLARVSSSGCGSPDPTSGRRPAGQVNRDGGI
uniref:N-acetyltransferase domain-containing protein n=1 Tax=Alexandrium monilatum TaxID=311494 RepID=A0A7S4RKZ2_9DINO